MVKERITKKSCKRGESRRRIGKEGGGVESDDRVDIGSEGLQAVQFTSLPFSCLQLYVLTVTLKDMKGAAP